MPKVRLLQIAPFWFVTFILVAGIFTPGYSHLRQAISELASPVAPLADFVPLELAFLEMAKFL
jgi:hypothetical protein